jgi:hypothetical protein
MRIIKSSGLRASVSAVGAVAVTALIALLFESPYTAWGTRTQPPEQVAMGTPAADHDVHNV